MVVDFWDFVQLMCHQLKWPLFVRLHLWRHSCRPCQWTILSNCFRDWNIKLGLVSFWFPKNVICAKTQTCLCRLLHYSSSVAVVLESVVVALVYEHRAASLSTVQVWFEPMSFQPFHPKRTFQLTFSQALEIQSIHIFVSFIFPSPCRLFFNANENSMLTILLLTSSTSRLQLNAGCELLQYLCFGLLLRWLWLLWRLTMLHLIVWLICLRLIDHLPFNCERKKQIAAVLIKIAYDQTLDYLWIISC